MKNENQVWEETKRFWGNPLVLDPALYHDKEEADTVLGAEIACYDFIDKRASVHMPNLESRLGKDKLGAVEKHELGHDRFCPHDLKTLIWLIAEADAVTGDLKLAGKLENLFADILVNTHMIRKGDRTIIPVYERLSEKAADNFGNLYLRVNEKMWGLRKNHLATTVTDDMERDASTIATRLNEDMYHSDRWGPALREFAEIMKKYLPPRPERDAKGTHKYQRAKGMHTSKGAKGTHKEINKSLSDGTIESADDGIGRGGPKQSTGGHVLQTPAGRGHSADGNDDQKDEDIVISTHSPKDYLPKMKKDPLPEEYRQIRKQISGISKSVPYAAYRRIMEGTGSLMRKAAVTSYYLDLAARFELEMPLRAAYAGDQVPSSRQEWLPEHEVGDLDIMHALSSSGRILPGEDTYRWRHEQGEDGQLTESYCDLLICLDSSQSMPNPEETISVPALSSIVLAHSAIAKGKEVAAINFSTRSIILGYSSNRYAVDDVLLTYQGEDTLFPGEDLLSLVNSNQEPQYIVIITDTQIQNLNSQLPLLERARKNASGASLFCFGSGKADAIISAGYRIHQVESLDQLFEMTKKLSYELYR